MDAREEEGRAKRITYSRELLLAVGGSEACKALPAGFHLLSNDPSTATLWASGAARGCDCSSRAEARGARPAGRACGARLRPESSQTGVGSKSKPWPCTRFFSKGPLVATHLHWRPTPARQLRRVSALRRWPGSPWTRPSGAVIGRGGATIREISRASGARLRIRDHERDAGLKNVELEGTTDQIRHASAMVWEHLPVPGGGRYNGVKTRLCAHFARGSCTYGDGCRFAHGESELRRPAPAAPRDPCGW
ncbi:hypothetical protein VPH35_110432 [Triticum aestivum]